MKYNCKNVLSLLICAIATIMLTGCGHNRYNEYKATGLALNIPMGDLGSLGICIGTVESSVAMVRGGSSISTETATGAGIFAGAAGSSKITTIKFNEQLNEGNIVKIMESPDVPDKAKIEIAQSYSKGVQAPDFKPSAMQTRESTLYNHGFTTQLTNQFKTTGIDKLAETVENVAADVADTTETIINNATDAAKDAGSNIKDAVNTISDHLNPGKKISETITDASEDLRKTVAKILMIVVLLVVLVIYVVILYRRRDRHRHKPRKPEASPPEEIPDK